jgi:formate-dependent nitrite reductase membrane component NrfD
VAHLIASLLGAPRASVWLSVWLAIAGGPLAAMAAMYTAFLFAQCKARDLWQSPLLPPHLLAQAVLAGAAALALVDPGAALARILAIACLAHVAVALAEIALTHGTAHARLAAHEMTRGRYRGWFWGGLALTALGALAPWLAIAPPVAALAGLLAFEHAHVQAGQAVPLA